MARIVPYLENIDDAQFTLEDLKRLYGYLDGNNKSIGKLFAPGILSGLRLVSADGITGYLTAGAALLETGEVLVIDLGDVSISIAEFKEYGILGAMRELWLCGSGTDVSRSVKVINAGGGIRTAAVYDTYSLEAVVLGTIPDSEVKVKIGNILNFNTAPDSFIWSNTGNYIVYNYSLNQLTHLGSGSGGKYVGSQLQDGAFLSDVIGSDQLTAKAVTNDKIDSISGDKFSTISEDKLVNLEHNGTAVADYTIGKSKLSREVPRMFSLPRQHLLPLATVGAPTVTGIYTFADEAPISRNTYDTFITNSTTWGAFQNFISAFGIASDAGSNILLSTDAVSGYTEQFGFWVLGRETSSWVTSSILGVVGTNLFPPKQGPGVLKIHDGIPKSMNYPDQINISGILPLTVSQFKLVGVGNIGKELSPYLIPPSGYVIDNVEMRFAPMTGGVLSQDGTIKGIYESVSCLEYGWLYPPGVSLYSADRLSLVQHNVLAGTYVRGTFGSNAYKYITSDSTLGNALTVDITLRFISPDTLGPAFLRDAITGESFDPYPGSPNPYVLRHIGYDQATKGYTSPFIVWTFVDRDA